MKRWLLLAPVLMLLASTSLQSQTAEPPLPLSKNDNEEMRTALLEQIPIGTSIGDARAFMERSGFACEFTSGPDGESTWLSCNRHAASIWPVSVRWDVKLKCQQQRVSEILVNSGLAGP